MSTVHTFDPTNNQDAAPWWGDLYRRAFPGYVAHDLVSDDIVAEAQLTAPELLGLTAAALFVLAVLAAGIADAVNAFRTGHSSGACVPVHDRAPVAGGTAVPSPAGSGDPAVRAGTQYRQ